MKVAREDNLVVALRDLNLDEIVEVEGETYRLTEQVSAKHKFAAKDFEKGDLATMYGVVVGETTQTVPRGGPLTTENLIHRSAGYGEQTEEIPWNVCQTSLAGRTLPSMAFTAAMVPSAPPTTGWSSRWSSAKTETWSFFERPCCEHWVTNSAAIIRNLPRNSPKHAEQVAILVALAYPKRETTNPHLSSLTWME